MADVPDRRVYCRIELSAEDLLKPPKKSFAQLCLDERLKVEAMGLLALNMPGLAADYDALKRETAAVLSKIGREDLAEEVRSGE